STILRLDSSSVAFVVFVVTDDPRRSATLVDFKVGTNTPKRNKAMGCIVLLLLGFRLWISPVFPATSSTLRKPLFSSGIVVSPYVARPGVIWIAVINNCE